MAVLNIALLGACPVQLSEFAAALDQTARALRGQIMLVTADGAAALPAGLPGFDLVLLAGLETPVALPLSSPSSAPCKAGPGAAPDLEAADRSIRAALALAAVAYRVLYGTAGERLAHALQAVESLLPGASRPRKAAANPDGLKSRPWAWMCDKCSDPQCEHRLLSALLAQRDSTASAPGKQARVH
jgi:hypothetical protein